MKPLPGARKTAEHPYTGAVNKQPPSGEKNELAVSSQNSRKGPCLEERLPIFFGTSLTGTRQTTPEAMREGELRRRRKLCIVYFANLQAVFCDRLLDSGGDELPRKKLSKI